MRHIKVTLTHFTNIVVDAFLTVLAILMLVAMVKQLIILGEYAFAEKLSFTTMITNSLSFFMYFEFTMMIKKYIDEGHHIPIRYLVYIALTAILRQEMVTHGDATQTLILSIAIFLLVLTLIALEIVEGRVPFSKNRFKK
ncbi:phosphate-starvation-inducible PsiE family protein [Agrilactobacillus composti]|uniref:phosphate-starvation-inducible PsiE family protein n=1 Tax=Agrilactobacillus composti TaxID=398555 RepID=UPI000705151A|nr:phosphate-starvation-inducible PsiE family protein [Agrilactobacillus composti]